MLLNAQFFNNFALKLPGLLPGAKKNIMKINLIPKLLLLLAIASFIVVPVACSSDDSTPPTDMTPDPDPDPDPDPVPDPTNENTTIEASESANMNGTSTSTITVQIADSDGNLFTESAGTVALATTGMATLSDVTDNGDGTYTATITSSTEETTTVSGTLGGTAITDTAEVNFNPDDSNPAQEIPQSTEEAGPSILRINCGGPEVTFGNITFLADQYFSENTETYTNPFVTEIEGTDMDEIYLTERVTLDGTGIRGPMFYNIPVTNGTYTVKLYFAEIYWGVENPQMIEGDIGSRVFNISLEDTEIFTGYDLFKDIGAGTADTRMYDIEVTDGELTIALESTIDKPKISAIEVFGNGSIGN